MIDHPDCLDALGPSDKRQPHKAPDIERAELRNTLLDMNKGDSLV
ncbi:MAG: hypothetical protein OXU77_03510 [Gammaproteobacteria bacterium]|nr:hypothetical protein [Gammaproteobacteria bacterium]MDE0443496.1 hypothetical protein [Gammaproteobacteria bacterium]